MLEVADLDAAARFYGEVLGLPAEALRRSSVVPRRRALTDRPLDAAGRDRGGQGGAHVHYAMHIGAGDYEAAVARLHEHGLDVHEEDFEDTRAAYVADPDGNVVELWTWGT